jgi:hypothetical protein
LAIGVAVAVSAGGVTAAGSSVAAGTSASAGSTSGARGSSRISSRVSTAAEARLARLGVRVTARVTDDATDCVAHSYGRVRQFFRERPCAGLHRAQFELRDRNGDVVLVPVSWVEMSDEAGARALKQLLDGSGTGNVGELSRERGRYRTVRYTGEAYTSRRDGTVVVNAQAQPVARGWAGLALTSIVTNAAQ